MFKLEPLLAGTPSAKRLGSFLVQAQLQTSVHSSALFLTAAAQNLLCMKLAAELGVLVASPWVTWFKAAFVPALVGIIVTPFLMFKVRPILGITPVHIIPADIAQSREASTLELVEDFWNAPIQAETSAAALLWLPNL